MIGRLLHAAHALAAGLEHAWHHPATPAPTPPPVQNPCPRCHTTLNNGPHTHEDIIVWSTDHDECVLLTDLHGGCAMVIHGASE